MAKAQIIVEEMRNLVNSLQQGIDWLSDAKTGLVNGLSRFDIDHTLGPNVQRAIDWGETELPGVRRRLALAESLENSRPEWPTGHVEIEETSISTVSPEQAQQNGEDAAQALIDSHGEIPADVIAEIQANMNDPYFAAGFAQNISPEAVAGLLDTYDQLGDEGYIDNFDENRRDLIVGLGTLFGTATRNTGDLAMPSDYADQWSSAITDGTYEQDGDAPQGRAQYLALLMQQGVYSRPFLNEVGNDLYEYENEGEDGAVWGPKSNHMDPVLDLDGNPVVDVMSSFMVSLSHNPLAAQDFFTSGGTETVEVNGHDVQVNSRLQYLTQERTWSGEADFSNGGNFGAALEAATTTFRDNEETGADSATIASQTFALIGEETKSNDGWKMWNGMRGNIANMLASYSPDLLRIASAQGNADPNFGDPWTIGPETQHYGENAPYGASLDPVLVQEILGTFGEDGNEAELEVILAGVTVASQWRMSSALEASLGDGHPIPAPVAVLTGQNVPRIGTAAEESARGLGWVINSAYLGALDEEDLEQKRAELMSQIFGAVTAVPGVGPTAEWSKFAFEQATGLLEDEIKETDPSASGDYGVLSDTQKTKLEQMVINQMLASGYWDQEYIDQANGVPGATRYAPPPPEAIIDHSDPPQIDFNSAAYQNWRETTFPLTGFLGSTIYPYYEDALNGGLGMPGR